MSVYLFIVVIFSLNNLFLFQQQCILQGPIDADCTYKPVCPANTTSIITLINSTYSCTLQLKLKAHNLSIQGVFSALTLTGMYITIGDLGVTNNLTILHQNYVQFNKYLLVDGFMFLDVLDFTNNTIIDQVTLFLNDATVIAKRIIMQTRGNIQMTNSSLATYGSICLYRPLHISQYSKLIYSSNLVNITQLSLKQITISLLTLGSISIIANSTIQTSTCSIISQKSIRINQSTITTSANACRTNMGSGRGLIIQLQNKYCSCGSSSAGYGLMSDPLCNQILQYFMFLTHAFPYAIKSAAMSTGSGGYGYNNFKNYQNGAGGGIIYVFAKQQLDITDSSIMASGGSVDINDSLSAGSGGTIYLYSDSFTGEKSTILVNGGASLNNKGAGAGGIVRITFNQKKLIPHNKVWINVSQGYQADMPGNNLQANGIFYGPTCPLGRIRWYLGCQSCNSTTYNPLGSGLCLQCPSANSFTWNTQSQIKNPWQCFQNIQPNPYYLWIVPGQIDLISICCYIGLLILFSIFGVLIRRRIKKIKLKNQEDDCNFQLLKKDLIQEKILTDKLKNSKMIKPYELIYHMHRITVVGSNTDQCPWVLPLMPPEIIKKYVLINAYQNFAKKFNKIAKWTKAQILLTKILYLVYPLHWFYYDSVKKRKYRKLCNLLQESREYNLINNYQFQDKDLITIKYSKNKDYTSCYIDFFFYQKADLSYYNLSVPFIIYLSGEGNFIRPFYIEQNDPFVKAMEFIVNRNTYQTQTKQIDNMFGGKIGNQITDDKQKLFSNLVSLNHRKKNQNQLKKFIIKFNAISCTLDLSAPIKKFIETLSILIEFINNWNKKFFNNVKVQISLILMISNLNDNNIVSSSIHILSNKNKNEQFLQKIKNIIPRMNLNNEVDMKIGLFIYNPQQEINKSQVKQQMKLKRNESYLSQSLGLSQDDIQKQISQHLLQSHMQPSPRSSTISSRISRILSLVRYYMLSHQISKKDRYTIKLLQSFLILTQTVLVFVWSIKIQIPYFFVNLVAPFVGILWVVSDSYGFGKLFLIFNAMNLLNQIVTFLVYSLLEDYNRNNMNKIIICQSINLLIVILNMVVGSRSITFSKKLKNVD